MPTYSNQVILRNSFGQFIRECEAAAEATVQEMVDDGAKVAAGLAPKRTGRLAASIKGFMLSRTSGVWGTNLKYAAPQEFGAAPHEITAYVSFFWDKVGRMWLHPDQYLYQFGHFGADPINHPGNPATHYMQQSWAIMSPRFVELAKKYYPG